jgi:hypothetical protein
MAENADEDSSTGIDLICALCDNGGEIARYTFIYFLFYLLRKMCNEIVNVSYLVK